MGRRHTTSFARDRVALEVALRDLETYTLRTFPPDAPSVLAELKRRRCVLTVATAAAGGRELLISDGDIPSRLLAAAKSHRSELIALVAAAATGDERPG